MSVLAVFCTFDLASQIVSHELQAIADAKHRQAQIEDAQISTGRIFVVDRRRATGEDKADRVVFFYVFNLGVAGKNNGKNVLLADPPGDELRILGPEVKN